jgi:hypothetical protein
MFLVAGFDNDDPYVFTINKEEVVVRNNINQNHIITYGASWRGDTEPVHKLLKDTPLNFEIML